MSAFVILKRNIFNDNFRIILKRNQIINLLLVSLPVAFLNAQDSHYWSNQYGTEVSLRGRLVVGRIMWLILESLAVDRVPGGIKSYFGI